MYVPVIMRKQSVFTSTKATMKPNMEGFPSGSRWGRQRGDAPYSPMEKRGNIAATEERSRQLRAPALTVPKEGAFPYVRMHDTEKLHCTAARVKRRMEASDAKTDRNPVTWHLAPISHLAPYFAK